MTIYHENVLWKQVLSTGCSFLVLKLGLGLICERKVDLKLDITLYSDPHLMSLNLSSCIVNLFLHLAKIIFVNSKHICYAKQSLLIATQLW